jgi:hypothetical protein
LFWSDNPLIVLPQRATHSTPEKQSYPQLLSNKNISIYPLLSICYVVYWLFFVQGGVFIFVGKYLWITCVFLDEKLFTAGHRPDSARLLQATGIPPETPAK